MKREAENKLGEVIQGLIGDLWAIEPHLARLSPDVSKAVDAWFDATVAVLDEMSKTQHRDSARERNARVKAELEQFDPEGILGEQESNYLKGLL